MKVYNQLSRCPQCGHYLNGGPGCKCACHAARKGPKADTGTCAGCWKKAPEGESNG